MRLTTILLAVIMSINFMHLHAKDAESDSIQTLPTYEELAAKIKDEKKNDKKLEICKQMLEIKENENRALADALTKIRKDYDDLKGTESLRYLTDKASIFTEDLPENNDIHPALHSFARAIATIKSFNKQIEEMEITLANAKEEVVAKGDITYRDFLKSDVGIQDGRQKLDDCAMSINSMNLSMFSEEQVAYINDLYVKYETIMKKFQ